MSKNNVCRYCNSVLDANATICPKCGASNIGNEAAEKPEQVKTESSAAVKPTEKYSTVILLLVCVFLGYFGVHKFMEGKLGLGVLYFFTFGFFGIMWIIDIVNYSLQILKSNKSTK